MNRLFITAIFFILILISCKQKSYESNILDNKESIDHWEITRNFKNYTNSSLLIDTVKDTYDIIKGHNQVFIITIAKKPIFKKDMYISDLSWGEALLIELDEKDTLVTANKMENSKLFRRNSTFSPNHGIKLLKNNEDIMFKREGNNIWKVNSKIKNFVFKGELNFLTNQKLTEKLEY
jgi:hypothetical protein